LVLNIPRVAKLVTSSIIVLEAGIWVKNH